MENQVFATYILSKFNNIIFDFDNTLSKYHLAPFLEKKDWVNNFTYQGNKYLSNPELIKLILNNAEENHKIFIFTHGNNENGIRRVLENELGLELSKRIIIVAGRDANQLNPIFRPSDSKSEKFTFKLENSKNDMFNYVSNKLGIFFDKTNTIFFDDTFQNLDVNCDKLKYCTRVDIINKKDPFNNKDLILFKTQIEAQLKAQLKDEDEEYEKCETLEQQISNVRNVLLKLKN